MIRTKAAFVVALSAAAVLLPATAVAAEGGGTISGTTWHDVNADGLWQSDEPGLSTEGLRPQFDMVYLSSRDRRNFYRAKPDEKGHFRFDDVAVGTYEMRAINREGHDDYAITKPGGDSRADWVTNVVAPLVIDGPDTVLDHVDVGYFRTKGDPAVGNLSGPENLKVGAEVTYDFDLINNGDAPAVFSAKARWPAGLKIVGGSGGVWLFNPDSAFFDHGSRILPGESFRASFTLLVVGPVNAGEISVTAKPGPYGDANPADNTVSTPVRPTS
jgi:hypothetical protein